MSNVLAEHMCRHLKIGETEIKSITIKSNHIKFGFGGEGKTGASKEKPLGGEQRATCHKLNPLTTPSLGIKPGPHWWRASALTTAPSLLPQWSPNRVSVSRNLEKPCGARNEYYNNHAKNSELNWKPDISRMFDKEKLLNYSTQYIQ